MAAYFIFAIAFFFQKLGLLKGSSINHVTPKSRL
eukprot:UN22878